MDTLDVKSVVLFAAASVVVALILCVAMRRHKRGDPAIAWLMASNTALLVAAIGLLARSSVEFETNSILVIAGAYCSIATAFLAVMAAEGRALPWRRLLGIGAFGIGVQAIAAFQGASTHALMLTSSTLNSALTLWMAWLIWRMLTPYGNNIAALLCLPFAAFFTGYSLRLIAVLVWPESLGPMFATVLIVVIMAWAAIILELGMIALREIQARTALGKALEDAEAASRAKSRFMSAISHELRTPLNGVLGLAELMRAETAGPMPPPYRPFIAEIQTSGQRLLSLITDILDISAQEEDGMVLNDQPIPPGDILAATRANIADAAQGKAQQVSCTTTSAAPAMIRTDPARLVQLLTRLADNAVAFTPPGGTITLLAGIAESGGALLMVRDTGPGMNAEQLAEARTLFGRVNGVDNPAAGRGIGLPLAHALADAHGGVITLYSAPGEGTTATLILPPERAISNATTSGITITPGPTRKTG